MRRSFKVGSALSIGAFLMTLAACSSQSTPEAEVEVEAEAVVPRLAVGEVAPSFQLQDQYGEKRSLDELAAEGTVALVFYRSADW